MLSEICVLVSVGRPLWREDGSAICSVITQWSESHRIRNHTLLSRLRLPQPGGPGSRIYIPEGQGGPVIPPGTGFPSLRLLRLSGLWWRYSNPPPTWRARSPYIYPSGTCWSSQKSKSRYDRRPISMSWCLVHSALKGSTRMNFNPTSGLVHYGKIVYITNGRAACEACSATWNLGTNSAFTLGPMKTTENLDRVGQSQDLPDANWLLASSPTLNTRALTLVPICFFFYLWKQLQVFLQTFYLYIIWISTKSCITPAKGMNAYKHKYAYNYT
jgi:hypothetical protein